ncbi:hypothetical protein GCM10009730_61270 [Streptomyces albidochromogenes]
MKPVLKPLISGPSVPPDPVTPPRIMNNKGGKSCRTRRPEAPLRSHEKVTAGDGWSGALYQARLPGPPLRRAHGMGDPYTCRPAQRRRQTQGHGSDVQQGVKGRLAWALD